MQFSAKTGQIISFALQNQGLAPPVWEIPDSPMLELLKKVQIRLFDLWNFPINCINLRKFWYVGGGAHAGCIPLGCTRRVPPPPPPTYQNFLNFMQFLGKFVFWRLPLESWRPILREILDPPLLVELYLTTAQSLYYESLNLIMFFSLFQSYSTDYPSAQSNQ